MGWFGPTIGGVEHEGWVVPVFADGAEGAGTWGAQGVLVARKPGEGPSNGDRVQLGYPDGSQVVGIWQDDVLVLDDGVVYSHVQGQVRREVLQQGEEWRPDAAIVGYVAGCACGWRGRPWTRVLTEDDARLLYNPGPQGELDGPEETVVIDEWRGHIRPYRALEEIGEAAAKVAAATRELEDAVRAARAGDATWAEIGRAAGISRQAANERWANRL
jgi:hypothetical protein